MLKGVLFLDPLDMFTVKDIELKQLILQINLRRVCDNCERHQPLPPL